MQRYSNLLGPKLGYNGYIFNPTDWVYPLYPTRLSSCRGKHIERQYGSMKLDRLLGIFYDFCPYEVIWQSNNDAMYMATVSNSNASRDWMTENLNGYYRDLTWNDNISAGSSLGIWRSCVRFRNKEDAVLFKLTWVN